MPAQRGPPGAQFSDNDEDGNGTLNFEEFKQAIEIIAPSFGQAELKGAFRSADADGSGAVDKKEFLRRVPMFQQMSEDMDNGTMQAETATMHGQNAAVSAAAEKNLMALSEEERKEAEVLFKKFDKDKNSSLDFTEFRKVRRAHSLWLGAAGGAAGVCVGPRSPLHAPLQAVHAPRLSRPRTEHAGVSPPQVMRVIVGEGLSDSNMLKAFEECDKDGTGNIDYREFLSGQTELKKWKQKRKPVKKK